MNAVVQVPRRDVLLRGVKEHNYRTRGRIRSGHTNLGPLLQIIDDMRLQTVESHPGQAERNTHTSGTPPATSRPSGKLTVDKSLHLTL